MTEPETFECNHVGPDGYHCDRQKGHEGPHWAEQVEEILVRTEWPREESPVLGLRVSTKTIVE